MDILKEAVTYFKENDGYTRLFKEIKKKYISLGEIKGNIIINKPTLKEKEALSGLMKKDYSRNSTISINLRKMQEYLNDSKFSRIEIVDLIKEYFKEDVLTKREVMQKEKDELDIFWEDILKENENTYIYKFLIQSVQEKDFLYKNIKRYFKQDRSILKTSFLNACRGINNLPHIKTVYSNETQLIRIPVFASKITSNPHGFDKNTLCGKLFILLLCYINNIAYPKSSEELAELYYNNHLLIDDISNMVLCKNIIGYVKENDNEKIKYLKHKGLEGFFEYNEPVYLTLYNLTNLSYVSKNNKYKKVVITENPTVFMEVMRKCKIKDFPLICTYGQVKLAGIILMDLLVKQGYQLFYSGDIDPEGMQIADKLKQRYKENMCFLGFDKDVYCKNISNVKLNDNRLQKLDNIKSEELMELCNTVRKLKKASYEEENIDYIIKFITIHGQNKKCQS